MQKVIRIVCMFLGLKNENSFYQDPRKRSLAMQYFVSFVSCWVWARVKLQFKRGVFESNFSTVALGHLSSFLCWGTKHHTSIFRCLKRPLSASIFSVSRLGMLQLWKVGLSASVEGLVFRRFGRLDLLQVWNLTSRSKYGVQSVHLRRDHSCGFRLWGYQCCRD